MPREMGRVHSFTTATTTVERPSRLAALARGADVVVGGLLLALMLPLMGVLALAVRRSSHGPVLHREPGRDRQGRPVELLSFRTALDGSGTVAHERLRAVVGDGVQPLTRVGRVLRVTRADRLPRLYNVVAGHASLLSR